MKPTPQGEPVTPQAEESVNSFIRDVTQVTPRPKSEVRRRLNNLLHSTREEERTKFINELEQIKALAHTTGELHTVDNIDDLLTKLKGDK